MSSHPQKLRTKCASLPTNGMMSTTRPIRWLAGVAGSTILFASPLVTNFSPLPEPSIANTLWVAKVVAVPPVADEGRKVMMSPTLMVAGFTVFVMMMLPTGIAGTMLPERTSSGRYPARGRPVEANACSTSRQTPTSMTRPRIVEPNNEPIRLSVIGRRFFSRSTRRKSAGVLGCATPAWTAVSLAASPLTAELSSFSLMFDCLPWRRSFQKGCEPKKLQSMISLAGGCRIQPFLHLCPHAVKSGGPVTQPSARATTTKRRWCVR